VAERLAGIARATDTLARIDQQKFAMILEELTYPEHAERVKQKVEARSPSPSCCGSARCARRGRQPAVLSVRGARGAHRLKLSPSRLLRFTLPSAFLSRERVAESCAVYIVDTTHKPAGFADVGYDEAMRRARELIPFLREQAPKCEELRRMTPEVMDALHRTGLIRYMQPKVWGGMELPYVAYFDIPELLSRGDAAVGWTVTISPPITVRSPGGVRRHRKKSGARIPSRDRLGYRLSPGTRRAPPKAASC
jgi:hypothetical protein